MTANPFQDSPPASRMKTKNVVIFGEGGVGKSSTVNMIFERNVAATSSSSRGCTFESRCYSAPGDGYRFNIYDTVGLNEADRGRVKAGQALKNLIDLMLRLDEGVHLLVMCIQRGRISYAAASNYQVFYEGMFNKRIPIILVITHCEQDEPIDQWKKDNEFELKETYDMKFEQIICVTTLNQGEHATTFAEAYRWSQLDLREAIIHHALKGSFSCRPSIHSLGTWLKKTWNHIADSLNLSKRPLNKILFTIFRRFCSSDAEAIKKSNEAAEKIERTIRGKNLSSRNRRAIPDVSDSARQNIELQ